MSTNCLKISNFPESFSNAEKEDFLKHFGAVSVDFVGSKNSLAFASFDDENGASTALKRLHQLEILGKRLITVYSKRKIENWTAVNVLQSQKPDEDTSAGSQKCYEKFLQNLNAWSLPLNLSQPPPSHITYLYPPPSIEVLANIARALVAVPKFYNQVLHLMNKMNLPSPFHSTSPEYQSAIASLLGLQFNLSTESSKPPVPDSNGISATEEEKNKQKTSSSESELESDSEPLNKVPELLPLKRKSADTRSRIKVPKLSKPQKSSTQLAKQTMPVTEVFELSTKEPQKNITLKLSDKDDGQVKPIVAPSDPSVHADGFGILFPVVPSSEEHEEKEQNDSNDGSYISVATLRGNRVPERDRSSLPVFRNYQPGAPSCRLYVKNLAKATTARDLHFIFRAFIGHRPLDEEANKMFDILLMTEGRMKGQAFITFPSVEQAQNALKEANGYILHDKPMVIQFGRSKVQNNVSKQSD
ncbi:Hypothetical predicted protein [Cloeon dipterum]|uniref:RNA-binding region-containing protein 3 n=1 Tax=Cloeon dipterum TaxID=197152 RepID=A0A8S1D7F2_9INSE|nr:Hypothetical predicted protein [Cloeon dipterum]